MRKIVMFNRITLDGFFAGPHGEIDWFVQDPEVDKATHELMHPDTIIFGRVTFDMFEAFWPHVADDPNSPPPMRELSKELTQMTKIVFSKTSKQSDWANTTFHSDDLIKEVKKLKQGDGADITIFGSGTIVQQLANEGLIDEYIVAVTPVVLGEGKPLFKDVKQFGLDLLEVRKFASGNALLHYKKK